MVRLRTDLVQEVASRLATSSGVKPQPSRALPCEQHPPVGHPAHKSLLGFVFPEILENVKSVHVNQPLVNFFDQRCGNGGY